MSVEERLPPFPTVGLTVTLLVKDMDALPLPPPTMLGDTLVVRDPVEDRDGVMVEVRVPPPPPKACPNDGVRVMDTEGEKVVDALWLPLLHCDPRAL